MRLGLVLLLLLLGACVDSPNYDGRPCGPGRTCPDAFLCNVGGICRRACGAATPCPGANDRCEGGLCVTPSERDAGQNTMPSGECEGADRRCAKPPAAECVGDEYRTYASEGTCDTSTNKCIYVVTVRECVDCENRCLGPCASLTCDDLQGGCRSNGRCEPNETGGVECFYNVATNGGACTQPDESAGICADGLCTGCDVDDDCRSADACVTGSRCVAGACTPGERTVCDSPPACGEATGTCDAVTGECSYAPLLDGTTCDDDNMCTTGETCTGGVCMGGTDVDCDDSNVCTTDTCAPATGCANTANTLPCDDGDLCTFADVCGGGTCGGTAITCTSETCVARSCNGTATCNEIPAASSVACASDGNACTADFCNGAGQCAHTALANGTSCGGAAAQRCCGGSCVNISSNESHCGGCFTACATGLQCESVSVTSACSPSPANTTGRCRCQMANAQCPRNQICRTVSPYTDRCAPPQPSACAPGTTLVEIGGCPDYCAY